MSISVAVVMYRHGIMITLMTRAGASSSLGTSQRRRPSSAQSCVHALHTVTSQFWKGSAEGVRVMLQAHR